MNTYFSEVANTSNTSTNAHYKILSFLEAQPDEWTVTQLAKELKIPRGTVSWALKNLKEQGKVFYRPVGKVHLYAATRQFTDDFNLLFKKHKPTHKYEIHGLTLKLTGNFANILPQGGGVVRAGWGGGGRRGLGETSFQLSGSTLMVWGSFSECPLDFDRFLVWLARVDGFCLSRGWPGVEGCLGGWCVVQYGFNRDWLRFRNDSPTRCVSLQGFKLWFARVYDKGSLGVLREEVHGRDVRSLEEFVGLVSGSMTTVQILQFVEMVTRSVNSTQKTVADLVVRIGQLADTQERLADQVERIVDGK